MKERAQQGIGVDVNQANLITQEQENYFWEHGFLDSENAEFASRYVGLVFKPGFHMIAPIARVAPIAQNSVQTIQAIIWKQ